MVRVVDTARLQYISVPFHRFCTNYVSSTVWLAGQARSEGEGGTYVRQAKLTAPEPEIV